MVRAALSFGSGESVEEELFVYNPRRGGDRGSEGLPFDVDLLAPHPSPRLRHVSGALVLRDGGLACLFSLYWRLEGLDSRNTLFSVFACARMAPRAPYSKSLVPSLVPENQTRDAKLRLIRACHPNHATIEGPEYKATGPTVCTTIVSSSAAC